MCANAHDFPQASVSFKARFVAPFCLVLAYGAGGERGRLRVRAHERDSQGGNTLMIGAGLSATAILLMCGLLAAEWVTAAPQRFAGLPIWLALGVLGGAAGLLIITGRRLMLRLAECQTRLDEATEELASAKLEAQTAQALLRTEPQMVIAWDRGGVPQILIHTLPAEAGVPARTSEVLRIGSWLAEPQASALARALETLLAEGRAFHMLAAPLSGAALEVEGRAVGGRLIVRLREVSAERQAWAKAVLEADALSAERSRLSEGLDGLPMPVWIKDAHGRLVFANRAFVHAVEAETAEEVTEKQIELLESAQRRAVAAAVQTHGRFAEPLRLVARGERRMFDVAARATPSGVVHVAFDITEYHAVQKNMDQLSEAHAATLDQVATGVAIYDAEQRLSFFNRAYAQVLGLDPGWLASSPAEADVLDHLRSLRRLPEEADYRGWKERFLAQDRVDNSFVDIWHLPDGRTLRIHAELRADGSRIYFFDDETERLALESQFNALISVQRETLDHLKEGVALFGPDGRLRLFNPAFAGLWRLSVRELETQPHINDVITWCRVLHDDGLAWTKIKRAITAISERRQTLDGELVRADDTVVAYAVLPLPDGATLVTFVDLTDTKRVERALRQSNEALEAAARLKSTFIQHVSYELRTPLQNIVGFSDMLASRLFGELNERQQEYLGDIRASASTLTAIIDDILDLTTIDAGALELNYEPVAVAELIAAAEAGVSERIKRVHQRLDVALAADVSTIDADRARLTQVIYNLLSNAVSFSEPGATIWVRAWHDGTGLAIEVEDKGAGIPKDLQSAVFDRFVSHAGEARHRGAGLGLAMAKSLVELHGGAINLASTPGQGTRVRLWLPLSPNQTLLPNAPKPPVRRVAKRRSGAIDRLEIGVKGT